MCCITERESERELEGFFRYGRSSRALLKPLEAGYLSYYVIRLAGTSNESCGNLSPLWIAPSTTTIYQLAPHHTPTLNTHTHSELNCTPVWMGREKWMEAVMGFQC